MEGHRRKSSHVAIAADAASASRVGRRGAKRGGKWRLSFVLHYVAILSIAGEQGAQFIPHLQRSGTSCAKR